MSRNNVVGTASRLRGGRRWHPFSIPGRSNMFSLLQNAQAEAGAHPHSQLVEKSLFTPGINFTPNAPSLTAKVKNGLDFTSPTPCLHGVSRVSFPLYRQGRPTCTLTEKTENPPPPTQIYRKAILPTTIFLKTVTPLGCETFLYSGTENLLMARDVS